MSANADHSDGVSNPKYRKLAKNNAAEIQLNPCISSVEEQCARSWKKKSNFKDDESGIELCHTPFTHCVLPNFLTDQDIVDKLQDELQDLDFIDKNNDLYKFHQTAEDLKTCKSQLISSFRNMLCTKVKSWLTNVTGIPLNDTVDAFCAQYMHTDTLLCHDDELEGRRIAYIYYLVADWSDADGGALDLFSVDENIQPKEVVKSILPVRNNFVFFEVSPGSFHQVAEILSDERIRLSVSGWFHGPPIDRPPAYIETPRPLHSYGDIDDETFFDWINPVYLGPGAQGSIQEKFENDSEIELQDFLQKDKYEALLDCLKSSDMCWKHVGPANKRCYKQADDNQLPDIISTAIRLFKSDAMFLLLSNLTGLRLHELAAASSEESPSESDAGDSEGGDKGAEGVAGSSEQSENKDNKKTEKDKQDNGVTPCTARCRTEVRHWGHKCYTLVHDTDTEGAEFALDLVLYVGCEGWEMDYGGFTSYIAKGEDEELLTVTPQENSLALVYRDQETLKFVKYLNTDINNMQLRGFYDIAAVYFEK